MSVEEGIERVGRFTSSEIHKLMSNGKQAGSPGAPFYSYVEDKRMELRLGRPIKTDADGKEVWWGKLNELRVFGMLGLDHKFEARTRYVHPDFPNWSGMPDTLTDETVSDIKCPFSPKSFCIAVDSFGLVTAFKEAKPEWYWQLISNAILCDKSFAEIDIYMPYRSELAEIRDCASEFEGNQNKVARFMWAEDEDLPWLPDDGHYKNLNTFRFEVPNADKEALIMRVEKATELLLSESE